MTVTQVIEVQIKGTNQVVGGFKKIASNAVAFANGFNEIGTAIGTARQLINEFVVANGRFNKQLLSVQGNLARVVRQFDALGNEITDFGPKVDANRDQVERLLIDLENSTRNFIDISREGITETLDVILQDFGLLINQTREFQEPLKLAESLTQNFAAALGSIGLPANQARQEFRALVRGQLTDRNAILAQTLQITKAEFNQAKQRGELADLLNNRLREFAEINQRQAGAFGATLGTIEDVIQTIGLFLGRPLLQPLNQGFLELLAILDQAEEGILQNLGGAIEGFGDPLRRVGRILADITKIIVEIAQSPAAKAIVDLIAFSIDGLLQVVELLTSIAAGEFELGRFLNPEDFVRANTAVAGLGKTIDDQFDRAKKAIAETNEEFRRFLEETEQAGLDVDLDEFDATGASNAIRDATVAPLQELIGSAFREAGNLTEQEFQKLEDQFNEGAKNLRIFRELPKEGAFAPLTIDRDDFERIQRLRRELQNVETQVDAFASPEVIRLLLAVKNGYTPTDAELERIQGARQGFRNINEQLRQFAQAEGGANVVETFVNNLFNRERADRAEGLRKVLAQYPELLGDIGVALRDEISFEAFEAPELISAAGQVLEEFISLADRLTEFEFRSAAEASEDLKVFIERTNQAIDLGAITAEEAVARIDDVLGTNRLLFDQQIKLITTRSKILREETKRDVNALKTLEEAFENLGESGQLSNLETELAGISVEAEIAEKRIADLTDELEKIQAAGSLTTAQEVSQLEEASRLREEENRRVLQRAQTRQQNLEVELEQAKAIGATRQELEAIENDITAAQEAQSDIQQVIAQEVADRGAIEETVVATRRANANRIRDIQVEIAQNQNDLDSARLRQLSAILDEELRLFREFTEEQNREIERAAAQRQNATLAATALLGDSQEANLRRLEDENALATQRLDLAIETADALARIARERPPTDEVGQQELLADINTRITEVLRQGNAVLEGRLKIAEELSREREAVLALENQIEQVRRDSQLQQITQELRFQEQSLDSGLSLLTAANSLEEARLGFLEAQREQRERERSQEEEFLQAARAARTAENAEQRSAAASRAQELARELGISFRRFESERSIQAKLARLARERARDERESEEQQLQALQQRFRQERLQLAIDEQRARIQNQVAIAEAEATLAQQQAKLRELELQLEVSDESRNQVVIALELQKVELETAKLRLEGIKQATLAALDGEQTLAEARAAADAAAAQGLDPSQAIEGFRQQLTGEIDAGIDALDQQIAAIDEQIAQQQELGREAQLRRQLLEEQIEAQRASIAATERQISFLQEEAAVQEQINGILRERLRLQQQTAAAQANFSDRNRQRQAEQSAARPITGQELAINRARAAGARQQAAGRGNRNIQIGENAQDIINRLSQDPRNVIDLPIPSRQPFPGADASMSNAASSAVQSSTAAIERQTQAIERNTQAVQQTGATTVVNQNNTQLANRSLLVRTQGV